MLAPALTDHFSTLASRYDAVLCDVWGVVHNGVRAHAEACDALARFRADRGTLVLISLMRQDEATINPRLAPPARGNVPHGSLAV